MLSLRFHYAVHPKDDQLFCVEIPNYDARKISAFRDYAFSCRDKTVHAFNVRHLSNDVVVYIEIFFTSYCLMASLELRDWSTSLDSFIFSPFSSRLPSSTLCMWSVGLLNPRGTATWISCQNKSREQCPPGHRKSIWRSSHLLPRQSNNDSEECSMEMENFWCRIVNCICPSMKHRINVNHSKRTRCKWCSYP